MDTVDTAEQQQWKIVKLLFEEVMDLPVSQRASVVRTRAAGNESLEQQVFRLLEAHAAVQSFMAEPAAGLNDFFTLLTSGETLQPGAVLAGRFQIRRLIAQGGMGAVYEAWDSELQDRVALKTIRPEISLDTKVIEQFKEEVRIARTIAHPNVCRVYDLYAHELDAKWRLWFLTMEFIDGETLASVLRTHGPLHKRTALELARQMANGLAVAHKHDVVHRDFKCSNVMLQTDASGTTRVVITDFGLAWRSAKTPGAGMQQGGWGTPAYMSPEQMHDGLVLPTMDQYALGITLFEMLTCQRPFRVVSPSGEIVTCFPGGEDIPGRWRRVIRRCLALNPEDRFASVEDILSALQPFTRRHRSLAIAGLIVLLSLGVILSLAIRPALRPGGRISELAQLTSETDLSDGPSVSSDGQRVVYASDRGTTGITNIWLQYMSGGASVQLTKGEFSASDPAISPDGSLVAFRTSQDGGGISILNADRRTAVAFLPGGRNPAFAPDGETVAYWVGDTDSSTGSGKLFLYSLTSLTPVPLLPNFRDARRPVWSNDGQHILYSGCNHGTDPMPACAEWWITDRAGHATFNTHALSELRTLGIQVRGMADWHTGRLIFSGRKGSSFSLWELNISPGDFQVKTAPSQLTAGDSKDTSPSLSAAGQLAFVRLSGSLHLWRIDRAVFDNSAAEEISNDAGLDICPFISHDGRWLVFSRAFTDLRGVWVKNLQTGAEAQWNSIIGEIFSPLINEAGDSVVYEQRTKDYPAIFLATAGHAPTMLCSGCNSPTDWVQEENSILHQSDDLHSVKLLHLDTRRDEVLATDPTASLGDASWSPNTRLLAFTSASKRGKQIFFIALPKLTAAPAEKWQALTKSSEFAERPRWSGDGKYLFYMSTRDGSLCLWRQRFNAGRPAGNPVAVQHYHLARHSPSIIVPRSFNLSVAGSTVFLDLPESVSSIWSGRLTPPLNNLHFFSNP